MIDRNGYRTALRLRELRVAKSRPDIRLVETRIAGLGEDLVEAAACHDVAAKEERDHFRIRAALREGARG